jgi:hypothetical protein
LLIANIKKNNINTIDDICRFIFPDRKIYTSIAIERIPEMKNELKKSTLISSDFRKLKV